MQDQEEKSDQIGAMAADEGHPTTVLDDVRETAPTSDTDAAAVPQTETQLKIGPESNPESEQVPFRQDPFLAVDSASVLVERLKGMALVVGIGGPLLFILSLVWILGNLPSFVYFPLILPLLGAALLFWQWPALQHRHLRYCVDASGLRIRRGVLWRSYVCIPATRVQHTDVTQGPMQRHWSLATLTVHTAGTRGASIRLAGLDHEVAQDLRNRLLPRELPVETGDESDHDSDDE